MSDYLTDGAHVLIAGSTGSGDKYGGKSVTANWWYCKSVRCGLHDMAVYFDPKGLSFVEKQADASVSSLAGLKQTLRSGSRVIQFNFEYGRLSEQHKAVRDYLRTLPGQKIVVHDEAHEYADVLGWFFSQAGNLDNSRTYETGSIRSLAVTQRAWNLPENLRANMPLKIWVGPLGNEGRRFFQNEQMQRAGEKIAERTGQYCWSVTDAGDYVETNSPVPEEYA